MLLIGVIIPISLQAGVFEQFKDQSQVTTQKISIFEKSDQLQGESVPFLSATKNPDPKGANGGGEVIVREGVLLSGGSLGKEEEHSKTTNGEISVYVVREGDSLSQIAEMYDVTTNTILWANDIESSTDIHPGDTLVILPVVGIRHVVKEKDTIGSIAKKYGGDVDEILSYNQIASADALSVGDTIVIPGGEIAQPTVKKRSVSSRGSGVASPLSHPLPGAVRTQGIHGYNGVDLAASMGTPIHAAGAGEVIISKGSGWNGGYGNYIVIRHANGTQTLYSHTSKNSVSVGEYVAVGQTIAYVGSTGRSTGPHLHFEVRGAKNPF